VDAAQDLLKDGSDINFMHTGWTPLMNAAVNGKFDMVEFLMKNGADLSLRDSKGKAAVDLADDKKHQRIVSLLNKNLSATAIKEVATEIKLETPEQLRGRIIQQQQQIQQQQRYISQVQVQLQQFQQMQQQYLILMEEHKRLEAHADMMKKIKQEKGEHVDIIIVEIKFAEIWENQRRKTLFHQFSSSDLLHMMDAISERGQWSDEKGNDKDLNEPAEPGWSWEGDWQVELGKKGFDEEGWHYGLSWGVGVTGGGMSEKSMGTSVRKRRWLRKMQRLIA